MVEGHENRFQRKRLRRRRWWGLSPIVDGTPIGFSIPSAHRCVTTSANLELSGIVEAATEERIGAHHLCRYDRMSENGRCAFDRTGAAQAHLANDTLGSGDVFQFFGLFVEPDGCDRRHRLFGYLHIEVLIRLGADPLTSSQPAGFSRRHPHERGRWHRPFWPGGPLGYWRVAGRLREFGSTCGARPTRPPGSDTLITAACGHRFIANVDDRLDALRWCDEVARVF